MQALLSVRALVLTPTEDIDSILKFASLSRPRNYSGGFAISWTSTSDYGYIEGFSDLAGQYVVGAVTVYFHSIAFAAAAKGVDDSLQDILCLLTLWFSHGATVEVQLVLQKGFPMLILTHGWLCCLR
ncbi:hypothetical protein MKX01_008857 [Papaver californicum]|nr:hypothetical protein MKX01_008857 [Papaver californicum]